MVNVLSTDWVSVVDYFKLITPDFNIILKKTKQNTAVRRG